MRDKGGDKGCDIIYAWSLLHLLHLVRHELAEAAVEPLAEVGLEVDRGGELLALAQDVLQHGAASRRKRSER